MEDDMRFFATALYEKHSMVTPAFTVAEPSINSKSRKNVLRLEEARWNWKFNKSGLMKTNYPKRVKVKNVAVYATRMYYCVPSQTAQVKAFTSNRDLLRIEKKQKCSQISKFVRACNRWTALVQKLLILS